MDNFIREIELQKKSRIESILQIKNLEKEIDFIHSYMEKCEDDLNNLLNTRYDYVGREESEPLLEIEILMYHKLFKEIVENVHIIHNLNFEIIHGNLKPSNILLSVDSYIKFSDSIRIAPWFIFYTEDVESDRKCYLTDFEDKFIAPEITERIDKKMDIYSIGQIGLSLFQLDGSDYISEEGSIK